MSQKPQHHCEEHWLYGLASPAKNRFFYGMLLTDEVLRKEQRYGDGKRWLLNRLALGQGVLSGLDFELTAQAGEHDLQEYHIRMRPGVAVDGLGREIVVAQQCELDAPLELHIADEIIQPGKKQADVEDFIKRIKAAVRDSEYVLLQIAYQAIERDHLPVKAGNCTHECEPSTMLEQFQLRVIPFDINNTSANADETAVNGEPHRSDGLKIYPLEPVENVHHRDLAQLQSLVETPVPDIKNQEALAWVSLGLIKVGSTGADDSARLTFAKVKRFYRQLYSNDNLSKLVFNLADRLDEAARVRTLTFVGLNGASGEAQTASVYQPLPNPLKLKVTDSLLSAQLRDHESVQILLEVQSPDGGKLSLTPFVESQSYATDQPNAGQSLKITVDAQGVAKDVYWRLSKAPGPHTVVARILPVKENDPPFHPGSQRTYHATAVATAPTIVGMKLLNETLWIRDPLCNNKLLWNVGGTNTLRIYFSRRVENVELFASLFKLWRLRRHREKGYLYQPREYQLLVIPSSYIPVGYYEEALHEDDIWQADFALVHQRPDGGRMNLVDDLCPADILRLAVLARLPADATPAHAPSSKTGRYPNEQVFDIDHSGSYLSVRYRDRLLAGHSYGVDPLDINKPEEVAIDITSVEALSASLAPIDIVVQERITRFWDRFQPRDCPFPTGDGVEGGDFHRTFEVKLPHC